MHWTLKIKKESSAVGSSYGGCVAIGDVMSTSSEGRTTADEYLSGNVREFLSTSSARRTTEQVNAEQAETVFLSTSSARRTTGEGGAEFNQLKISIHVLREEDDA